MNDTPHLPENINTAPEVVSHQEQTQINDAYQNRQAQNTQRSYKAAQSQFLKFCQSKGFSALPEEKALIAAWINQLHNEGKKISTITARLAAVKELYDQAGKASPTNTAKIRNLLKGYENKQKQEGIKKKQAPALVLEELERVCMQLHEAATPLAIRDRAILLMGFLGAFRRAELAGLKWEDIQPDQEGFTVELTDAKNLKGDESQVKAFWRRMPESVCPIQALETWKEIAPDTPYIFTTVYKGGKISDNPLLPKYVDRIIKKYFGPDYSAHSLRVGFVTEAARNNAKAVNIAQQTGHKTLHMIKHYTRFSDAREGNAARGM